VINESCALREVPLPRRIAAHYVVAMRPTVIAAAVLVTACARATSGTTSGAPAPASPLPPIPLVTGALAPAVVYPVSGSLIGSRDSNFIFGSVGNGHASLTINGVSVPVLPNGSFIAYLANPPVDSPQYVLVATLGADTARLTHAVKLQPLAMPLPLTGKLVVDTTSVAPSGTMALPDDEPVRVSLRAPRNAAVVWSGDGASAPLVTAAASPGPPLAGTGAAGTAVPTSWRGGSDSSLFVLSVPAQLLRARTQLVASRDGDTVRVPLVSIAPAPVGVWGVAGADSSTVDPEDREIIGRPTPAGTYKWFLLPGTVLPVTGWQGDFVRVRLDADLEIWMNGGDVRLMPVGWDPAPLVASSARLEPAAGWVDLVVPMTRRPAYLVEEDESDIVLTIYGAASNTDVVHYGGNDSLVRVVDWQQVSSDRVRYTLHLSQRPFGYLVLWDARGFVLRVRRPPRIDPGRPLAGLTIAVDPGHPPIGATGPTGLWEPVPTLAIGERVRALLEARGATVVMTRTTPDPVPLGDRPIIARKANAHALVSIHLNALPDGINPFAANGTGAYFFRSQSEPLARFLQQGMVARMGLRNLGVNYDNLRLARPTWMPAVLCEGAFIMMPEQEAALRTSAFQEAYALGVADGLERYFRWLATGAPTPQ